MATLQEKHVKFNSKMVVSNTGGNLSSDAGLILVKEFMNSLGFYSFAKQFLHFNEDRIYWTHDNISLLEQLLFQLIAGYSADSSANLLKEDPIFRLVLDKEAIASQASLSRFWDRISEENIAQFQELNQAMLDKVRMERNNTQMIIDLDSTHSDTFGNQEKTEYNAHYGTQGLSSVGSLRWPYGRLSESRTSFWKCVYVKRCKRFSGTDAHTLPSSPSLH